MTFPIPHPWAGDEIFEVDLSLRGLRVGPMSGLGITRGAKIIIKTVDLPHLLTRRSIQILL